MTPARPASCSTPRATTAACSGRDPQTGHEIIAKAQGATGPMSPRCSPRLEAEAGTKHAKKDAQACKAVKPRTASLFKDMDLATIDLDTALRLLSLPRVVGVDAEGVEITAQNGRYGPYLKKGTDSRSLATEAQLFDVTLEEALAIYAQPKTRRRPDGGCAACASSAPTRCRASPIVVKDGRFGPYVTDGETNATLRKADDPATITTERAHELIAEKRARGPVTRKRPPRRARPRRRPPVGYDRQVGPKSPGR
jgi:DNA topoisomerase-1